MISPASSSEAVYFERPTATLEMSLNFLQNLQRVLAGDLHQIVRPAVEAHALADGLGVGARDFIFSE